MNRKKEPHRSVPSSIVEAQMMRLMEVVETYQNKLCQERIEQDTVEARAVISKAYETARARLKEEIRNSRDFLKSESARIMTKQLRIRKHQEYATVARVLERVWALLPGALIQRWQQEQSRQQWIDAVVHTAANSLLSTQWLMQFAPGFHSQERTHVSKTVLSLTGTEPQIEEVATLQAGLIIHGHGAGVDGSLQGLLASRLQIEAQILAVYRQNIGL
ncbi:MAG: hypothetical protein OEZ68_07800 [Gammaproteobacteria bacterium]|nr:hypothetical protein [Gammaproteobacteria bacterium]MDH5800689.1 hypothetical protein [Gammaproteobacteria bacterium]